MWEFSCLSQEQKKVNGPGIFHVGSHLTMAPLQMSLCIKQCLSVRTIIPASKPVFGTHYLRTSLERSNAAKKLTVLYCSVITSDFIIYLL